MLPLQALGVCNRRSAVMLTVALVFSGSGNGDARAEGQKPAGCWTS